MKLLLLTPQLPYPPRQGTAIRNFNLIDQLARRHTVDLLTFLAPDERLLPDNPLHEICRRVEALPQPQRSTMARFRGWWAPYNRTWHCVWPIPQWPNAYAHLPLQTNTMLCRQRVLRWRVLG